jgi:hypothetical protein
MIELTLGALDMWALDQFPAAFELSPTLQATARWQPMFGAPAAGSPELGLPGQLRFFGAPGWLRLQSQLPRGGERPLFGERVIPDWVVGYGAGNVPGTALLIAFLAQATALAGGPPPVVVVKNSRREPVFAPLVLDALEAVDPGLVATVAVLIWDYEDEAVQERLLSPAARQGHGLAIAAASDGTIDQIGRTLRGVDSDGVVRYHRHGHKVSFSAIGRETLAPGLRVEPEGLPLIDAVALLAGLDSVFWDQHGCLSSRIHFVETGDGEPVSSTGDGEVLRHGSGQALAYAEQLAAQLGLLAAFLPRGAWPRQRLHDRFDRYKLLEATGQVRVLSSYDDEFVVVLDARPLSADGFQSVVNDCEGRVIIVRPVADLMEVPERYLGLLPAANLQSLSVAVGRGGEGLTERFLRFAGACGARGVTALRTVGRGAFPQLAYSWDGLIPLDLVRQRPAGWFTTIEFEQPYDEMLATYRLLLERGAETGLLGR